MRHIATVEFRYHSAPEQGGESPRYRERKITLGVYLSREQAIEEVNKLLPLFEERFKLNPSYNRRERFDLGSFSFGDTAIITNRCWVKSNVNFFITIAPLDETPLDEALPAVLQEVGAYDRWLAHQEEEEEEE